MGIKTECECTLTKERQEILAELADKLLDRKQKLEEKEEDMKKYKEITAKYNDFSRHPFFWF